MNAKSLDCNNKKTNTCGNILAENMQRNNRLCMTDGKPTRRNSDSVNDLFIVTPRVVPQVVMCETKTDEAIRSNHNSVLLDVYQTKKKKQHYDREVYN